MVRGPSAGCSGGGVSVCSTGSTRSRSRSSLWLVMRSSASSKSEKSSSPGQMGLGGGVADEQFGSDLAVGQAPSDECQHLAFSLGDAVEPLRRDGSRGGTVRELLDQASGDARRDEGVTGGHDAGGGEDVVQRHVLDQESAGPRPERGVDVVVVEAKVVSMSTRGAEVSAVIIRVASMPSMPGIWMSITTTSGRSSLTSRTASVPVPASPTISRSGASAMTMRRPARTRGWSSARTMRLVIPAAWLSPESRPRGAARRCTCRPADLLGRSHRAPTCRPSAPSADTGVVPPVAIASIPIQPSPPTAAGPVVPRQVGPDERAAASDTVTTPPSPVHPAAAAFQAGRCACHERVDRLPLVS